MDYFHTDDYNKGAEEEVLLLETLRTFFNDKTIQLTTRFDSFDFRSYNYAIELKRRYCDMEKYDDTMISTNKINIAEKHYLIRDYYFFFKFNNGLFYWKYSPEEAHLLRQGGGGRVDRGVDEIRQYYFIPIRILKKMT